MKQLLLIFFVIFASFSFAQNQSAEEIIEQVKQHYQSNEAFSADVSFEIDIPESENQLMEGKIYLKGNKYKFMFDDQEIISDDVNMWHWSKGDINEVQVSYVKEDESVITPAKVFNEFLDGYSYKLDSTPTVNGEQLELIEITPKEISDYEDIFKIKVVSKLADHTIKNMQIYTKDGTVYEFDVSNEQTEQFGDSVFTFNETDHPDVQLIDLR